MRILWRVSRKKLEEKVKETTVLVLIYSLLYFCFSSFLSFTIGIIDM